MDKLKACIRYECVTSFKYIWIFYAIEYALVTALFAVVSISTGSAENPGTNGLELNTFIYLLILGVFGFSEDFKMLIQNGFTRRFIFLSTVSMFALISGIMAFLDTILGRILHGLAPGYTPLFYAVYGHTHSILLQWLWMFLVYLSLCCLGYLTVLVVNKLGKMLSVCLGIVLALVAFVAVPVLISYGYFKPFFTSVATIGSRLMGFAAGGAIHFLPPFLTFLLLSALLALSSYRVIIRTELKS